MWCYDYAYLVADTYHLANDQPDHIANTNRIAYRDTASYAYAYSYAHTDTHGYPDANAYIEPIGLGLPTAGQRYRQRRLRQPVQLPDEARNTQRRRQQHRQRYLSEQSLPQ